MLYCHSSFLDVLSGCAAADRERKRSRSSRDGKRGMPIDVYSADDLQTPTNKRVLRPILLGNDGKSFFRVELTFDEVPFYRVYDGRYNRDEAVSRTVKLDATCGRASTDRTRCETYVYKKQFREERCVIWPKNLPLSVNGSTVIRCDNNECLAEAYVSACVILRDIGDRHRIGVNVFVLDLDETLIDGDDNILPGAADLLYRLSFEPRTFIVVWSHGNSEHVHPNLANLQRRVERLKETAATTTRVLPGIRRYYGFCDLVITHDGDINHRAPKNPLHLYTFPEFNRFRIDRCVLIDDTVANVTPEYTDFIIPQTPEPDLSSCVAALLTFGLIGATSSGDGGAIGVL